MALDSQKLNELLGKGHGWISAATFHAALVQIGDRLGLYKALSTGGAAMSLERTRRQKINTEQSATCARWLSSQAAGMAT